MKTAGRLGGSVALLAILVWRVDFRQIFTAFGDLYWPAWWLALGIYLVAQIASAWRWSLLARAVGLRERNMAFVSDYFVGMFFNLFLPTSVGGDVVRAWRLARRSGSAPASGRTVAAVLSVLAERLSGLAVLIALACLAVGFCPLALPPSMLVAVGILGAGVLLAILSLPLLRHVLLPWLLQALPRFSGPLAKIRHLTNGAALLLHDTPTLIATTALSLVVQVANIALVAVIGAGLGLPVPTLFYAVLVPLVTLLTLLPVSLNGVGLREAGFVVLLRRRASPRQPRFRSVY